MIEGEASCVKEHQQPGHHSLSRSCAGGGIKSRFDPIYSPRVEERGRNGSRSGSDEEERRGRVRSMEALESPKGGKSLHGGGAKYKDTEDFCEADFIKVSHRDDFKKVAGKIAWNARAQEEMPLLASGAAAITTALGAMAKAREYLAEDDIELLFQPAYRDREDRNSLAFFMQRDEKRKRDARESSAVFSASKNSKVATLAGAVAGRARGGVGALIEAIGDDAVSIAIMAVAKARVFLRDDNLDIKCLVTLESIEKMGGDGIRRLLTSFKIKVYLENF